MSNIRATIITIGDELLIGQTIDTNSAWIAQHLNLQGIDVVRRVAVGDTRDAIWDSLTEELTRNELIIVTGGLGPTADDITKPLLCEFFGGKLIVNEKVLEHVKNMFTQRNRPFLERNLKQAEVPDVCTVLSNRLGTAPGMWFEQEDKVVISLPGVPFEMECIMEDEVLPRLQGRFKSDSLIHRSIITAGEGESFIAEQILDLETALPMHIKLAYLPSPGMVRLRLTGRGKDEIQLIRELDNHQQLIAERLEKCTIALEDIPLEHVLGNRLREKGLTLGLAESCTGGYIGHKITQISGSSDYFTGGIVCYHEQVKKDILGVKQETLDEFSVVSEEVAIQMAEGVRNALKTDIGFGITGLLSSSEGYNVPVGTICVALTDKERTISKTFRVHSDRLRNKEIAVGASLLLMLRFVTGRI
jgi:nicotinamide-nucleotide amidase